MASDKELDLVDEIIGLKAQNIRLAADLYAAMSERDSMQARAQESEAAANEMGQKIYRLEWKIRGALAALEHLIEKWDLPASDGRKPDAEQALGLAAWCDMQELRALLSDSKEQTDD